MSCPPAPSRPSLKLICVVPPTHPADKGGQAAAVLEGKGIKLPQSLFPLYSTAPQSFTGWRQC